MVAMSSSNAHARNRKLPAAVPADLWMLVASSLLLVAYLSVRTRMSNYVYVLRWIIDFSRSFINL